ncbi:unnamed protein product [Paramecium octaurelia]|uniref:Uncharacterized protein n=1 Tax=Paramecium octaurelia TaxID=43137 RepID=A0A8S1VXF9_PAROT|nr:unnamed protein product [Paramecium octaurelia]
MSKLPEFKIPNVVDPKLWPNPRTMSPQQLQTYTSLDMVKLNYTFKTLKKSAPYIVGVLAGCFFTKLVVDGVVKGFIFGENGNGGKLLEMKTYNSIGDYTYNRQFQRMRYLTELPAGDDPLVKTSDYLLHDLGVTTQQFGVQHGVVKKVPHDKYLL